MMGNKAFVWPLHLLRYMLIMFCPRANSVSQVSVEYIFDWENNNLIWGLYLNKFEAFWEFFIGAKRESRIHNPLICPNL